MSVTPLVQFKQHLRDPVRPTLVLWFAHWCPHCQRVKPQWAQVQHALGSTVYVDMVDVDEDRDYVKSMSVRSFPTIVFYIDKQAVLYEGDRSTQDILNFVCKNFSKACNFRL